jgi:hypothetical protein
VRGLVGAWGIVSGVRGGGRDGGCLGKGPGGGLAAGELGGDGGDVLEGGMLSAAAGADGHNGVADLEGGDLAADDLDDAGDVRAEDLGVLLDGHGLIEGEQVDRVEADGAVADADFIRARLGVVGGDNLEARIANADDYALADELGVGGGN